MKRLTELPAKAVAFVKRIAKRVLYHVAERRKRERRHTEYLRLRRVRRHTVPPYRNCKNCGEELHGMYCSVCGQYALDVKQSFVSLFNDVLSSTLRLDSKIISTLRYLCFHPAFLSREFMAGRIKSYVHPLKLYLFLSMILFGFAILLVERQNGNYKDNIGLMLQNTDASLQKAYADSLAAQQLSVALNSVDRSKVDSQHMALMEDAVGKAVENTDAVVDLNESSLRSMFNMTDREFKVLKNELMGQVNKYLPFFILLLMPIYAMMLRYHFRKTGLKYIDSFIFSVHVHSFAVVLAILAVIATLLAKVSVWRWFYAALIVYHVVAVHNFYHAGWFKSVLKTVVCQAVYYILISICTLTALLVLVHVLDNRYSLGIFS